jgi:hypothetical protein
MRLNKSTLASLVFMSSIALPIMGCDDGAEPTTQERSAESVDSVASNPTPSAPSTPALIEAPELPSPPSHAPAQVPADSFQPWLDAEVTRIQVEAPAWVERLMTVEPKLARSGTLRLVGPEFEDPNAAPVLLHRYQTAGEAPAVRAAVIAALALTQADYAGAIGQLLATETDATVRVAMVTTLRRASGPAAVAALELAFADVDPQVRMNAAITAGRHVDGASLATALIAALGDSADVQLAAARSIGYLKIESAAPALTALLASADAELRLASLQAIDRIDPEYAEGLTQLDALTTDADPKVARAAQTIAGAADG